MDTKKIIETVCAGVPGVHIQGQDSSRMDEGIKIIADKLGCKVKEWNWGYGWVDFETKRTLKPDHEVSLYEDLKAIADDDPTNKIYVIQNAYSALKNDYRAVARLQQELQRVKRYFSTKSVIFLIAKEEMVFPEIMPLFVSFSCAPLTSKQIEPILHSLIEERPINVSTAVKTSLISIFSGMERDMVFRIFAMLDNKYKTCLPDEAINDALILKKRILARSGLLELIDSTTRIEEIGGLEQLKNWLRKKKYIIDDLSNAEDCGISPPKGVLLAGMPGCGKSMSAKAAASLFNVPLFRLDIGTLMGKFVGESEANMKAALKIAEQASPCVLWVDELEKAFAGVNGSGGSAEITTRLFGYFLTWMQEKPGAVFVVATANDITTIPPELLRRGRFDEIFYIDLPTEHERKQIFKVKTEPLKKSSETFEFEKLAKISDGFSGADIECAINDALEESFRSNKKNACLSQEILEKHIALITPISEVLEKKITTYRELFEEFSLKAASLSEENIKNNNKSNSHDPSERENAAGNEFISPDSLTHLVKNDNDSAVRIAALKNPQCPIEALQHVVETYKPFDFSKPGSWTENQTTKEEFELALQHKNMTGEIILKLYERRIINNNKILSLANRLNTEERRKVFTKIRVNLPQNITSASIQNICCRPEEIVHKDSILLEIDDENGCTQKISAPYDGLVSQICVKRGAAIRTGEKIAQLLVPKK